MSWTKIEKDKGTDIKITKDVGTHTKIEKEIGIDTKIIKEVPHGSREMNWEEFGEVAWNVKEWTWQDLIIWIVAWTKILKDVDDWTKVDK